jgi:hypothetical protein
MIMHDACIEMGLQMEPCVMQCNLAGRRRKMRDWGSVGLSIGLDGSPAGLIDEWTFASSTTVPPILTVIVRSRAACMAMRT